jgi:hypothetical protein
MRKMASTGSESRGRFSIALPSALASVLLVGGCGTFDNMSAGGKGATAGAAVGTGIGLATGGGFARTIGGGLIGAGVGYIGGEALGND